MTKCMCGKEIAAVPDWLSTVKVNFVCNNCPNRELQGITEVDLSGGLKEEEPTAKVVDKMPGAEDDDDDIDIEIEEEEA